MVASFEIAEMLLNAGADVDAVFLAALAADQPDTLRYKMRFREATRNLWSCSWPTGRM